VLAWKGLHAQWLLCSLIVSVVILQALSLMRRMRSDLRKEMHRLSERQTKASRVLAQNGLHAATAALEAVCAQLEFVRSLRELYSAELAAHVAGYNLVSSSVCKIRKQTFQLTRWSHTCR